MRYELRARVESDLLTAASCTRVNDLTFELLVDESGRLNEVAVSVPVAAAAFASRMTPPGAPGESTTVELRGDAAIEGRLVSALQKLEAHLSFVTNYSVRRIHWHNPTRRAIPETPEERQLVAVDSWSVAWSYPTAKGTAEVNALASHVAQCVVFDDQQLAIAKAFWREAKDEHEDFRFVQAFVAYYYVIEGFFARGRTGEAEVIRTFRENAELVGIVGEALADVPTFRPAQQSSLARLFAAFSCPIDVEGALRLLFRTRGALHHFNPASPRIQGTPWNQGEFESLTLFASHVATLAIARREPSFLNDGAGTDPPPA